MYIDAIDLTGLGIALPDGAFAINVWTKEKISEVLSRDVQADGISYGKLPVTCFFSDQFMYLLQMHLFFILFLTHLRSQYFAS